MKHLAHIPKKQLKLRKKQAALPDKLCREMLKVFPLGLLFLFRKNAQKDIPANHRTGVLSRLPAFLVLFLCLHSFSPVSSAISTRKVTDSFPPLFQQECLAAETEESADPEDPDPESGETSEDQQEYLPAEAEESEDPENPDPESGETSEDVYMDDSSLNQWPMEGIAARVPVPDADPGTLFVYTVGESQFSAGIDLTEDAFEQYVLDCEAYGFSCDEELQSSREDGIYAANFQAFDSEGYKLTLDYCGYGDGNGSMQINLVIPVPLITLEWPDYALGLLLPEPPTTVGRIGGAPEIFLVSYLGDMPVEAYHEYVAACQDAGFCYDISETNRTFSAVDEDGIELSVEYYGNSIVYLRLFDPEQKWRSKGTGGNAEDGSDTAEGLIESGDSDGTDPVGGDGSQETGIVDPEVSDGIDPEVPDGTDPAAFDGTDPAGGDGSQETGIVDPGISDEEELVRLPAEDSPDITSLSNDEADAPANANALTSEEDPTVSNAQSSGQQVSRTKSRVVTGTVLSDQRNPSASSRNTTQSRTGSGPAMITKNAAIDPSAGQKRSDNRTAYRLSDQAVRKLEASLAGSREEKPLTSQNGSLSADEIRADRTASELSGSAAEASSPKNRIAVTLALLFTAGMILTGIVTRRRIFHRSLDSEKEVR